MKSDPGAKILRARLLLGIDALSWGKARLRGVVWENPNIMNAVFRLLPTQTLRDMAEYFFWSVCSAFGLFTFGLLIGLVVINRETLALGGTLIVAVLWLAGLVFCYLGGFEHYVFFCYQALLMFGIFIYAMVRQTVCR